ncbi:hypothetical protein MLD38_018972 [Melastoma candidum]|nr:hypothetical protein MLD38_018972 [Melastoma candidum]
MGRREDTREECIHRGSRGIPSHSVRHHGVVPVEAPIGKADILEEKTSADLRKPMLTKSRKLTLASLPKLS